MRGWLGNTFIDQVYSWEVGSRKPNKAIYDELINTIGDDGEHYLFFDDKQRNLDAAKSHGLQTYHVTSRKKTKTRLHSLDV